MTASDTRWLAAAVIAVVMVARVAFDVVDVLPGVLTRPGQTAFMAGASTTKKASAAEKPQPTSQLKRQERLVLQQVSAKAPLPTTEALTSELTPLLAQKSLGAEVSMAVLDASTGEVLFEQDADVARESASSAKLLTGAAVLSAVGGDTRLKTTVMQGAESGELVLVGGGDTLLLPGVSVDGGIGGAGLATLAEQVARRLPAQSGDSPITVAFDDSLFAGPNVSPQWGSSDVARGLAGRVSALGMAADRVEPGKPGPADPSAATAKVFATALTKALAETGSAATRRPVSSKVKRVKAPPGGRILGSVQSAPVQHILSLALADSDNALAEVLAKLTALAVDQPTTYQASARAVLGQVESLGVDTRGAQLVDGSGLGRGSVIPARLLVDVLKLAAGDRRPQLRPLITGLPVAGVSGTLADRFVRSPARQAAGVVRAKSGTLTGVGVLAGITVDVDGRLLIFAVMADSVPTGGTLSSRSTMDTIAATLAACGCR